MARTNTITYIAFHTSNNASDFGDTSISTAQGGSCASTVRAVQAHGNSYNGSTVYEDEIEYVTVASTGNASDFGDQLNAPTNFSSCSDGTRGEWWSGTTDGSYSRNNIFYITIASTGNATDGADASAQGWLNNSGTSGT
jgi:hypothetical protein